MRKKELKAQIKTRDLLIEYWRAETANMFAYGSEQQVRAEKAEAFIGRLVKAVRTPERYAIGYSEDVTKIMDWYEKLTNIADEWQNGGAA